MDELIQISNRIDSIKTLLESEVLKTKEERE